MSHQLLVTSCLIYYEADGEEVKNIKTIFMFWNSFSYEGKLFEKCVDRD